MADIEEIRPNLFVQKTRTGGWIVVNPIKKDLSKPFGKGNINWKNLLIGNGQNIGLILIVVTLLFTAWAYKHDTFECKKFMEDPCNYSISHCANRFGEAINPVDLSKINRTIQREHERFNATYNST